MILCILCGHQWNLKERSNVIQFDDMGYPLRLFICECDRCKKNDQMWIDSSECKEDVVLKWTEEENIPIPPKGYKKLFTNGLFR